MTTEEKINLIIEKRYKNYRPRLYRKLEVIHGMIRNIQVPYTKWQLVKFFFGFGLPERKIINNDEAFLSFLEKVEIELPKPIHEITDDADALINELNKTDK